MMPSTKMRLLVVISVIVDICKGDHCKGDHCKGDLIIGAFNIQTFGQSKYSNATLRQHLTAIVTQYDLILLQEIKDVSETMIFNFLADCQSLRPSLDIVVSPRLGSTSYKEQYAIIFDSGKLSVVKHTVYENPGGLFSRPPLAAHFSSDYVSDFTVFGVHVDPDDVVQELNEFPAAYEAALSAGYPAEGIFMGDMNADCSYLSNSKYSSLSMTLDDRFTWLIDKSFDTTVSQKTTCAYDRIVLCGGLDIGSFTEASVDYFDVGMSNELAKKISDHYPVTITWLTPGYTPNNGKSDDEEGDNKASQAISYFGNFLRESLCHYIPILEKHQHEDWFEASLVFFTFIIILACRRVVKLCGLVFV